MQVGVIEVSDVPELREVALAAAEGRLKVFWQETLYPVSHEVVVCDWAYTRAIRIMAGGKGFLELQWSVEK